MDRCSWTRREFLRACGVSVAALSVPGTSFAAAKKKRPNFLFLFTDDQTFRSVNALNNPEAKTPNIDRLAKNGAAFTHAFNQGSWSGAVCVCSRAMLNSGLNLYHAQKDIENVPLWGQTLGRAGYNTWVTGKWHNGPRTLAKSFKSGESIGNGMYGAKDQYNRPRPGGVDWKPWDKSKGGHWKPSVADFDPKAENPRKCLVNYHEVAQHTTDLYADNAIRFLKNNAAKSDDPFFMYVSFNAPHDPRQSPKKYVDMYPPDKIKLPSNYLPEHPFDQGERYTLRDEKLAPFPRTPEAVKVHISEYYAIITHADAAIGRILDALEESGKADNTYIIFAADHGNVQLISTCRINSCRASFRSIGYLPTDHRRGVFGIGRTGKRNINSTVGQPSHDIFSCVGNQRNICSKFEKRPQNRFGIAYRGIVHNNLPIVNIVRIYAA